MHKSGLFSRADRLLNDPGTAAKDAIRGLVLQNPHLALLDIGYTVVRRDYAEIEQVKIFSGGESGHEPLYAGFVGQGLLTAALQGDVFAAPSSFHIANVIKELSHKNESGVLVIIQNNSADALNFGVAIEKAQTEGARVMLIIVTDDCSDVLPSNRTDQPRGLTGVIILQKIAGALAEMREKTLLQMYDYCEKLQEQIRTVILTLKPCTSPIESSCVCFKHGTIHEVDIGGGLHGESGNIRMNISTTHSVIEELLKEMSKHVALDQTSSYVLMINNLCVSKLEEMIFVGELLDKLKSENINVVRLYTSTFMTSLDMRGFTITTMKVDEEILKYLDYPTNAPAWNANVVHLHFTMPVTMKPQIRAVNYPRIAEKGPRLNEKESNVLLLVLQFACDALISCERQLNIIDAENGDGDTGTRIKIAVECILKDLKRREIDLVCLYKFFKKVSIITERIGGTLAALYGIMFEAAANYMSTLDEHQQINCRLWLSCLFNIIHALKSHTKTEDGSKNMIAPLMACATSSENAMNCGGLSGIEAFEVGVAAAERAVANTKLPGSKYPDSGAHAVHIWMRAVLEGVKFRCTF